MRREICGVGAEQDSEILPELRRTQAGQFLETVIGWLLNHLENNRG
jgi:hypothetical protein